VEITCPSDCPYLASARQHPPAAAVRQQQDDLSTFVQVMRDLNERQSRLFLLLLTFLVRYQPPELHPLLDEDIAEAMAALGEPGAEALRQGLHDANPFVRDMAAQTLFMRGLAEGEAA